MRIAPSGRFSRLRAQARNAEAALAWPIDGASPHRSGGRRQQDCADGVSHHGPRREIQGAETVAGGMSTPTDIGNTNWRGHDDVMQLRLFRGSGEPAWVNAPILKCVSLFGTRSAPSIRASGQTCRTKQAGHVTAPDQCCKTSESSLARSNLRSTSAIAQRVVRHHIAL